MMVMVWPTCKACKSYGATQYLPVEFLLKSGPPFGDNACCLSHRTSGRIIYQAAAQRKFATEPYHPDQLTTDPNHGRHRLPNRRPQSPGTFASSARRAARHAAGPEAGD